jgi:hypothetical protein
MSKVTKGRQEECRQRLQEILRPGDTVWTKLTHVSRSGMMREIQPLIIKDGEPRYLTALVADLLEDKIGPHDGIKVPGCGMDMGFHLIYTLSYVLWPDGFDCTGEHCPSNDHFNRDNSKHHKDGGYALKQRWL